VNPIVFCSRLPLICTFAPDYSLYFFQWLWQLSYFSFSGMRHYSYLLLILTLFSACRSQKDQPAATAATPVIELERHGCRGFCPQYKLRFMSNGSVAYEGIRNMEKMGAATIQLSNAELAKLLNEVQKVNLWQYPERIQSTVADAPSSTMQVFKEGKSHSVTGSIDRPKPILELEKMLQSLAEAHGLKVMRGVSPDEADPNAPVKELLVKLKPEANIGNWMMQFSELKLRIVRRVSADNVWLVSYNPNEIAEKDLIELFKGTKEFVEAQPNKAVKERN
jgi:hypothetical protein